MALLFQAIKIRSIEFKNRLVVSPMCQYSSEDGFANDWHFVHLGTRAVGGAGLIILEASAVSSEGRITTADLGVWKDEHMQNLKRITRFLQANGTVPGIQLAHAGRKASHHKPWEGGAALNADEGAWETVSPSAIPFKEGEPIPTALSKDGIEKVIKDFRNAAERALKSGFKMIEIHAAHGYLLNEFLSPLSNQREDEYGGSFENRSRILFEVIASIRQVWPEDYPLFVRISASDYAEGGWTADDSVLLAAGLKNNQVDLVDCSSGGNVFGARIPLGPLYQVNFAERIKKETRMMTGAVGLITTAEEAEGILANGKADLVILARQFLRDPYFAFHAAKELGADVDWPVQYQRAK